MRGLRAAQSGELVIFFKRRPDVLAQQSGGPRHEELS